MKITCRLLFLAFVLCVGSAASQSAQAPAVSDADKEGITRAALDYAEGWYEGDPAKMERALHPELVKRILRNDPNTSKSVIDNMGASALINAVRRGFGKNTPKEKQLKDVTLLDVFGNAASVKVVMSDWIDYLHIAKFNGRWVIVNVLWELKPQEKK